MNTSSLPKIFNDILNIQEIQIKTLQEPISFEKKNLFLDNGIAYYDFYYFEKILNTYNDVYPKQVRAMWFRLRFALDFIFPVVLIQEILEYHLYQPSSLQIKVEYKSPTDIELFMACGNENSSFFKKLNPSLMWSTFREGFEHWITTGMHPRWISIATVDQLPLPNAKSIRSCRVFAKLKHIFQDQFCPTLHLKRRTLINSRMVIRNAGYISSEFKNQDLLLKYCLNSENTEIWSYSTKEENQLSYKIIVRISFTWTRKKSFYHKK